MTIAITGSSGFIGQHISQFFENKKFQVVSLSRNLTASSENRVLLSDLLENVDVIINLAGAPIIKQWTRSYRKILYDSRVKTTENLVSAIERCQRKPKLLISASAVGIYMPVKNHTEIQNTYNTDFLGKLCVDWENMALRAEQSGVRTVILRFGIVLDKSGGILKKLYPLFNLGLGAVILPSNGAFPYVHIADVKNIVHTVIVNEEIKGVFNLSANSKETQMSFAHEFAKSLKRPVIFRMPGILLKILYGKGAEIIYKNPVVESVRLRDYGISFEFDNLQKALE